MAKILNPATGRYVKADGKIGLAVLARQKCEGAEKEVLLLRLSETCNNTYDPVSLEQFSDMGLQQLKTLVLVGDGPKKNAYLLENIYMVYKTAVEANKLPRDPMNPSYTLSIEEISSINSMMSLSQKGYKPPCVKERPPYPPGYEISIQQSMRYTGFYEINVVCDGTVRKDLGVVPGWVESADTGSTSDTSAVLLGGVRELWDKRLLMDPSGERKCSVGLKRRAGYWRHDLREKFVALCEEVRDRLG